MTTLTLMFVTVSASLNLPDGLLSSVCFVESSHKPAVINKNDGGADSLGICQIKLATAQLVGYKGDANTLRTNTKLNTYYAGLYLHKQLRRYNDVRMAVAAYNAGKCNFNSRGQIRNQKYVTKVFLRWAQVHNDNN